MRNQFNNLCKVLEIANFDSIQIYNHLSKKEINQLRSKCGNKVSLIKVMSEKSYENGMTDDEFLNRYTPLVDSLLIDSSWIGGSGQVGNWEHCAEIVRKSSLPVFLAGGLTGENVFEAIKKVRPYGVDVENGVSTRLPDGTKIKNMLKCRNFIEKVREADYLIANQEK